MDFVNHTTLSEWKFINKEIINSACNNISLTTLLQSFVVWHIVWDIVNNRNRRNQVNKNVCYTFSICGTLFCKHSPKLTVTSSFCSANSWWSTWTDHSSCSELSISFRVPVRCKGRYRSKQACVKAVNCTLISSPSWKTVNSCEWKLLAGGSVLRW